MPQKLIRQRVWDIPTRLFHWLLVALFGFSWWSAEYDHMDWHLYSGLAVCGLLIFRIIWGFFGADTARFSHFLKGPRAIWSYLRPPSETYRAPFGHNPLGGWSVIALLFVLGVQIVSGLFAVDVDGIESGPLSYLIDFDQGRLASAVHHWSFNVVLGLIALHIAAIFFYLVVRRRNLIWTMIAGSQPGLENDGNAMIPASFWKLIIALLVSVMLVYAVAKGFRF